ncbi:DUF7948 domain-containing protein [Dyadobacter tibetensis]|uniref:DUF7948 domain-containing protein n=1 Tax=Dyadobacter tibetensis TaxID=1211851 RepID=UPI0018DE9D11|nr:T9SS type A sorting domain-containing protein [Dyadobacter tibetensis]
MLQNVRVLTLLVMCSLTPITSLWSRGAGLPPFTQNERKIITSNDQRKSEGLSRTPHGDKKVDAGGFIENRGQIRDLNGRANNLVQYLLQAQGLNVQLRKTGFSYDTYVQEGGSPLRFHRIDIELLGANPHAKIIAQEKMPGRDNFIRSDISYKSVYQYKEVLYQNIYPGIDLEFLAHPNHDKLVEYNFIIHPGADPSLIRLQYNGAHSIGLNGDSIVMKLNQGQLSEHIPASWLTQTKESLAVTYAHLSQNTFGFKVPEYDRSKTLVIDPTPNLEWATYYGGTNSEIVYGVDSDSEGNMYVTGSTTSTTNIASSGAYDGTFGTPNQANDRDIFIAKFSPTGQRIWGTYYGGADNDQGLGVTYHSGKIYLAASAESPDMATAGAHQTIANQQTALVARFNAASGMLEWATYYGGNRTSQTENLDHAGFFQKIAIDKDGNIFAIGGSELNLFPSQPDQSGDIATPGTFRTSGGSSTSFLVKFNASGERVWGTFLVGKNSRKLFTEAAFDLAIDSSGDVYVSGQGSDPTDDVNWAKNVGEGTTVQNGYVGKISGANGTLIWGRFIDGAVASVSIDEANNSLHIVGDTRASAGIASAGSYKSSLGSARDGYWMTLDLGGHYQKGTYLGGLSGTTMATDSKLDGQGNIIILGQSNTTGSELATECAYQPNTAGGWDVFLNKFDIASGQRSWGTYYGVSGNETVGLTGGGSYGQLPARRTLALLPNQSVGLGLTTSNSGLSTPGTHQQTISGSSDMVLAKFNVGSIPSGFKVTASSLAPLSQDACILGIPNNIIGNAVGVSYPEGNNSKIFYQWQQSSQLSGPWSDLVGEVFKDLQPLASNSTMYYRRLVKVLGENCMLEAVDSSQVATVNINSSVSPIAQADGPQWYVCGPGNNTVMLNGTASGGSGSYGFQWYRGSSSSGTALVETADLTTPAVTEATTFTLKVTDTAGCVDIDQVTVVPAIAKAGEDQSLCQGGNGVQIGTAPVASPQVNYSWTSVSGSPVSSLSCTNCAQPIANPTVATVYRLMVTVTQKDGTTCNSTDEVTVSPISAPNGSLTFAGTDKTICKNTTVTLGEANDASFQYTWTTGQYLSNAQIANPIFNAGTASVANCAINYLVSAQKSGCVFTDEVKVSVVNPAINYQNETKCGPLWVGQFEEANCAQATYSWEVVSGNGSILNQVNGGERAYLKSNSGITQFRRSVTLNGVSCSADVFIDACSGGAPACDFEIVTRSEQGCPKVFGSMVLQLGTTVSDPASYNFSWSPAQLVDNPSAAEVTINSEREATISLTITNKYDPGIACTKSIVVNRPGWALPVFDAQDRYTCPGQPIQIGNPANAGFAYSWMPYEGLNNPNLSNPTASISSSRTYSVEILETSSGCKTKENVLVNVSAPEASAGNDRAICNGATVTLGTPAPTGTNWQYSWSPSGAPWTNGTTHTDAQPQLEFAFTTPQTFILTVTDPLSGCTATDQVVLSNTVTAGEYAGAAQTTCEGVAVTLGRNAEPYAQYQWFMADGVTPAVGLSSNTVANPTLTNPVESNNYVVQVSYPGCSTPLSDIVAVTVNEFPELDLKDQVVCPAGPLAIGYGAAGNPTAPDGATYLWSPSAGLNSTTVANPLATVSAETVYTVRVTLASGCIYTDEVRVRPSADAGSDVEICPGETTVIGKEALEGAIYSWSGGPIVSGANTAQPRVNPANTTTYTVSVTLDGCTTSDQVQVRVNSMSDFSIAGNTSICEGSTTTLGLVGVAAPNTAWQWSPTAGLSAPNSTSTTVTPAATGTYRLTQTNRSTGCSNFKEVVVVVSPNNIQATSSNLEICANEATSLPLSVTPAGDYQYVWSPSTGLSNAYVANPTVSTGSSRNYQVTVTDNTSKCQVVKNVAVTIKSAQTCLPPVALSGNIFHDANGLKDAQVNMSSALPIPDNLFVTLVDQNGNVLRTVPVGSDAGYNFGLTEPGHYNLVLHQGAASTATPSLPEGWLNTGENLGLGNGNDAAINGVLTAVQVSTFDIINANFGIQQPPVADPKEYLIDQPTTGQLVPLDGTHVSVGAGTTSPNQMTGTDSEDGALDGSNKNRVVIINTLPDNGVLYYDGQQVFAGQQIKNYDPSKTAIELTGSGYSSTTYRYSYVDEAGAISAPVDYTIRWGAPLPVTLIGFSAKANEHRVLLEWSTADETRADRFEILRSANGKRWESLGLVQAAGNSAVTQYYSFADLQPLQGGNIYRLKMIDQDGSQAYSRMVQVQMDAAFEISIYPNPVREFLNLNVPDWSKVSTVELNHIDGKQVYKDIASRSKSINIKGFVEGSYILRINYHNGAVQTLKFVHLK